MVKVKEATLPRSIARTGYDPDFLATRVLVPSLSEPLRDDAVLLDGSTTIDYTHFSLSMSRSRKFARWVAWNIDGASIKRLSRVNMRFILDPRLPEEVQTGNELYADNRLDRGHLARRADLLWGEDPGANQANKDSFYYTNITPQMDDFNQSSKDGLWGQLENAVFEDMEVEALRVSVFAGPVFHDDDRPYRGTALPHEYWKLVVFRENGVLKASVFLLTQNLDQLRVLVDLDEFRVYQIALEELEERTGLGFPVEIHLADTFVTARALESGQRAPLDGTEQIRW